MQGFDSSKDPETDKYYLINNLTGESRQITKNGDYIKKFHLGLTGKANYAERVAVANGDQAYMPYSTAALKKFPEFYVPQPDKFDGYSQLPRTLQPPYVNNPNQRPRTTLEQTKRILKGRCKNEKYEIDKQLSYITGTAKDLKDAEETGQVQVLAMRSETKQCPYSKSVKVINNFDLTQPNLTLFKPYRAKAKSSQSLHRPQAQDVSQTEKKRAESRPIVPLGAEQLRSIVSYQNLGNQDVTNKEVFATKTFSQNCQTIDVRPQIDQTVQLFNMKHFQEKLEINQKEISAFQLPKPRLKQQISSKGRFNVETANNEKLYKTDRLMMKLCSVQPELFDTRESPKKIEQEKQRRKLAKMKEEEMLRLNLKRKC